MIYKLRRPSEGNGQVSGHPLLEPALCSNLP